MILAPVRAASQSNYRPPPLASINRSDSRLTKILAWYCSPPIDALNSNPASYLRWTDIPTRSCLSRTKSRPRSASRVFLTAPTTGITSSPVSTAPPRSPLRRTAAPSVAKASEDPKNGIERTILRTIRPRAYCSAFREMLMLSNEQSVYLRTPEWPPTGSNRVILTNTRGGKGDAAVENRGRHLKTGVICKERLLLYATG